MLWDNGSLPQPQSLSLGHNLILTFQQMDAVGVRLLEQPPEFGLRLSGIYVLAASGHPLPQHFLQVEDGQVGVVLFFLQKSGMSQTQCLHEGGHGRFSNTVVRTRSEHWKTPRSSNTEGGFAVTLL